MERLDDVLGYKDLKIYQNSNYFAFSLDSIILANYSTIRLRDRNIIDFCTGNGIIPLIISRRCEQKIVGVEVQESLCDLANKSVHFNHLDNRIQIICDDIKNYCNHHLNEFDLVLCNPPYFKVEKNSSFNDSYEKMIARHEILITLDDICDCAKKVLKDHGNICIVHRSDRLMDVLISFRNNGIEPKRIKFVHETLNKESTLVIVEGQKCGKTGLIVEKPLIQYNLDGSLSDEYEKLQVEVLK